jgi:hypothetical protein
VKLAATSSAATAGRSYETPGRSEMDILVMGLVRKGH